MRRKIGIVLMGLGVALVVGALALFIWLQWDDARAGESVNTVMEELLAEVGDTPAAQTEMTEVEIDGYSYIGYLSIPSLGLGLPVMSDWSYDQLYIAPCRYYGSTLTNDMVICAHNYKTHFRYLKDLVGGEDVYFTDMDGVTIHYEVEEVDVLQPTAIEEMTSSGFDLTLFTCTYGGASRVTVRCNRVQ